MDEKEHFRLALEFEIKRVEAVVEKMDGKEWKGLMSQIRADWLESLYRVSEFYRATPNESGERDV